MKYDYAIRILKLNVQYSEDMYDEKNKMPKSTKKQNEELKRAIKLLEEEERRNDK